MSHKGELQTLTKLSIRHQVCPSCILISESIITMPMSRGRSNCGVTYYVLISLLCRIDEIFRLRRIDVLLYSYYCSYNCTWMSHFMLRNIKVFNTSNIILLKLLFTHPVITFYGNSQYEYRTFCYGVWQREGWVIVVVVVEFIDN